MHAEFWHERWTSNQIGFHESRVNPLLVAHIASLGEAGNRIFLPLCGMTLDIDWLLSRGYRVAGSELSPLAVAQLFERLALKPSVEVAGNLAHWRAAGLDVFVGDIFELSAARLGAVDAVYDRAALIALPADLRRRYAAHLGALTGGAPQLLVTLEYDQNAMAGPPFSVDAGEVRLLYADRAPALLARQSVPGGLKGKCAATESLWLLGRARPAA